MGKLALEKILESVITYRDLEKYLIEGGREKEREWIRDPPSP